MKTKKTRAGRLNPMSTVGWVVLACGIAAGSAARADYLAYAVVDGTRTPLPESIAAVDAGYLADLEWNYRGGRSALEVAPVEDVRGNGGEDVSLDGIRAAITEAIRRTGRFGAGDAANGHVLHVGLAEYAVQVAEAVINPRAVRSRARSTQRGRFTINLRLVDATGRAVFTGRFEAAVAEPRPGVAGFGDVEGLPGDIWTQSIGQAMLAAANRGAFELVKAVGPLPLSGRIVRAEGDRVWINLGKGSVAVGDSLEVTSVGESLVDPETGVDLGALEETVGTVRVSQVQDRFSIAEPLSLMTPPSRGDAVRAVSPQPDFKFATDWQPAGAGLF